MCSLHCRLIQKRNGTRVGCFGNRSIFSIRQSDIVKCVCVWWLTVKSYHIQWNPFSLIYFCVTLLQVKTLPFDWNHFDTRQSIETLNATHNKTNHNFFLERKILLKWRRPKSSRIKKNVLENGLNVLLPAIKLQTMSMNRLNFELLFFGIWFWLRFFSILWNCLKIWRTLSIVDELILSQLAFNHITSWHLSI